VSEADTTPIVRLQQVCAKRGGRTVLQDITFDVQRGQFVGLVGPNGAGKTTLLKAVMGLVIPSSGRIEIMGRTAVGDAPAAHAIGYVPQRQVIDARFPATVRDVVMMGRLCCLGPLGWPRAADWRHVDKTLDMVDLTDLSSRPIGQLSGGEQRRAMLAQALCASTRLLVLDEPTIGLDLPAEHDFYALLRRLQAELALTIIAVSHDLVALAGEADQLICINGRMHIHGNPEDVVHSHAIREADSCEFNFLAGELAHHESAHDHDHERSGK
jgi:ABC-type Mn2+/Zn2+ transport system ATPase subunit